MIIYPDIEIKNGQAVNLTRGLEDTPTVYEVSPMDAAKQFEAAGAEWLHLVDIDGVFQGGRRNAELICDIIKAVNIPVQVGGGIQTNSTVEWWLEQGAERVVLGTVAVIDQHLVWDVCGRHPGKIVVSVDGQDGYAMIDGWRTKTSFKVLDLARQFEHSGVAAIIYTDIDRFENAPESSLAATTEMGTELNIPVISTGTVRELDDVSNLKLLPNIHGAIIGRAFFSGMIKLEDAIRVARGPGVDSSLADEGVAPRHDELTALPIRQIDSVGLPVTDVGKTTAFYEMLGFERESGPSILLSHHSGVSITLLPTREDEPLARVHLVLDVRSVSQTRSFLKHRQIEAVECSAPEWQGAVVLNDPDGHVVVFKHCQ